MQTEAYNAAHFQHCGYAKEVHATQGIQPTKTNTVR